MGRFHDGVRSAAAGDTEAESAVLSGKMISQGRKGNLSSGIYTHGTRNTTSSQPFGPHLLTWAGTHFSLGGWLLVGLDPRGGWVREDGVIETGWGDARRRRHLWWR